MMMMMITKDERLWWCCVRRSSAPIWTGGWAAQAHTNLLHKMIKKWYLRVFTFLLFLFIFGRWAAVIKYFVAQNNVKILKTYFYLYSYLTNCLVGSFLEVGVYLSNFRSKSSKNKPPEYWIKRKHTSTLCPLKSVCIFDKRLRIFFPRIILFWKSLISLCQWASKSCWKPHQNVSLGK